MTKKYFKGIKTIEELKKAYKEFAKKLHPDLGGDTISFQEMSSEYDVLLKDLKANKENKTTKDDDKFKDIINELVKYNELTIEIIGTWLWVGGNTYQLKDIIKNLGLLWSKGRKKWYYTSDTIDAKNKHYKKKTYDELKKSYGYVKVKTSSNAKDELKKIK